MSKSRTATLLKMFKRLNSHVIGGREPNVDWWGKRPTSPNVTMDIRINRADRNLLVKALKAYEDSSINQKGTNQ